jgi:hypothetical protein
MAIIELENEILEKLSKIDFKKMPYYNLKNRKIYHRSEDWLSINDILESLNGRLYRNVVLLSDNFGYINFSDFVFLIDNNIFIIKVIEWEGIINLQNKSKAEISSQKFIFDSKRKVTNPISSLSSFSKSLRIYLKSKGIDASNLTITRIITYNPDGREVVNFNEDETQSKLIKFQELKDFINNTKSEYKSLENLTNLKLPSYDIGFNRTKGFVYILVADNEIKLNDMNLKVGEVEHIVYEDYNKEALIRLRNKKVFTEFIDPKSINLIYGNLFRYTGLIFVKFDEYVHTYKEW